MEISFHFVQAVFNQIKDHELFRWSLILAQSTGFIIVILHYFRLYYSSFGNKESKINVYDILRPIIYLVLLGTFPLILNGLDQVTEVVEVSWAKFDNVKLTDQIDQKVSEAQGNPETVTQPPPTSADQQTAKAISRIWNVIENPSIIIIKILDWLVYAIDSMIFAFSLISRAAFMFVLRFLAPFALVASIFEHYRKYFWNWLKIYVIVYLSVYVFFVINTFSDAFTGALWDFKVATGVPEMMNAFSTVATLLMLCMVLVKTFLYFKSVQLMYKVYNSNA